MSRYDRYACGCGGWLDCDKRGTKSFLHHGDRVTRVERQESVAIRTHGPLNVEHKI